MNQLETAYLAGIVDGEGCVSLFARRPRNQGGCYATPAIQISNTSRVLIDWLLENVPGSTAYFNKDDRPTRKHRWQWCIFGRKARDLILVLRPYLIVKAPQADVILRLQEDRDAFPLDKRDPATGRARTMPTAYHQLTADAIAEIRLLNQRGATASSSPGPEGS